MPINAAYSSWYKALPAWWSFSLSFWEPQRSSTDEEQQLMHSWLESKSQQLFWVPDHTALTTQVPPSPTDREKLIATIFSDC